MPALQQRKHNTSQETELSDGVLLGQSQAGDEHAFEALVSRYQNHLLNYIRQILKEEDQQDDVLQFVFLKLYLSLPTLRRDSSIKAWLFQVAHNRCIDELRSQRRQSFLRLSEPWDDEHNELVLSEAILDPHPLPEEIVEQHDLHAILQQALDELPPRCRSVVQLHFFGGLSFREIAELLGIPTSTAKTYCHRSLKRLRCKLAAKPSLALIS